MNLMQAMKQPEMCQSHSFIFMIKPISRNLTKKIENMSETMCGGGLKCKEDNLTKKMKKHYSMSSWYVCYERAGQPCSKLLSTRQ